VELLQNSNVTVRKADYADPAPFGISGLVPESVRRAYAIEPAAGSTYLDAEHIVILMQENCSFDHALGT
jgi:phospholipase C